MNKYNAGLIIQLLESVYLPDLLLHRYKDILDEIGLSYSPVNSSEYGISYRVKGLDDATENLMKVLTREGYDHEI